jgi:hypothetical protein
MTAPNLICPMRSFTWTIDGSAIEGKSLAELFAHETGCHLSLNGEAMTGTPLQASR